VANAPTVKLNGNMGVSTAATINDVFRHVARRSADIFGSPLCFLGACALIIGWAITGPFFHYSETWQLVINTATTIVTFLMVFLIQNTQNRDSRAVQLKLDELIKSVKGARNSMIDLDRLSDEQLHRLEEEYKRLCSEARECDEQ